MNDYKIILTKLKQIIGQQLQTNKKVLGKDVAQALSIKSAILASYKNRNKTPHKAILTYCHDNRLDVRKILFDEVRPIIDYPKQTPIEDGKVSVKYFRTLASYEKWLGDSNGAVNHKKYDSQIRLYTLV